MPNQFIHCHECNRGGRGNAEHKCSCGWRTTEPSVLGCYLGTPIEGEPRKIPKMTAGQRRYRRWLEYDCGMSFIEFLKAIQREKNGA